MSTPKQKNDFEALFKRILKGKFLPWKLRKSTRKSLSQPGCSHSNTIYDVQLQKTIVLRMQPRHRATLSTQGVVLRLPPQNIAHATFMQPLQCDLQPQLQETHRTTPQEQPPVAKHIKEPIASGTTAAAPVAHTRYLSSSPAATLHGKTQGFVLRLPPQNIAHATFMQPLQCDLQPQLQETHRTTPQEQPLIAKHIEGTNRVRNDRSRTRRTHEVPFIVACSHFTRKNSRFRAPASSRKHSPCNIHAAITMRSATTASGNA